MEGLASKRLQEETDGEVQPLKYSASDVPVIISKEPFHPCKKVKVDKVPKECNLSSNLSHQLSYQLVKLLVVARDKTDVVIKQESCNAVAVNIQEGEDDSSTDGVLQAVKVNEKHTLSLGGKEVICHNTWFKEYSHTYTDQQHGAPQRAVYFYECYDFPNHYIHWRCGDEDFAVDCEPETKTPCNRQFQWKKKPVAAQNGGLNYFWLIANTENSSQVSPFYLTFQNGQPKIDHSINNAMKLLISPAKPDTLAQST